MRRGFGIRWILASSHSSSNWWRNWRNKNAWVSWAVNRWLRSSRTHCRHSWKEDLGTRSRSRLVSRLVWESGEGKVGQWKWKGKVEMISRARLMTMKIVEAKTEVETDQWPLWRNINNFNLSTVEIMRLPSLVKAGSWTPTKTRDAQDIAQENPNARFPDNPNMALNGESNQIDLRVDDTQ